MFKIVILILMTLPIFAIMIDMKEGKEKDSKYSTIHILSKSKIKCVKFLDEFETISHVDCEIPKKFDAEIKEFSNSFFDIEYIRNRDKNIIKIYPRYQAKLMPINRDISELEYFVPQNKNIKYSKHWLLVGFQGATPPFFNFEIQYNPNRINFPIKLENKKMPFIGALDIDGNPIREKKTNDLKKYIELKKYYDEGEYRKVIQKSNNILRQYPNTLFKPELILYQIRSLFKLKAYQKIINIAKNFLRDFSADNGVPEVLLYTAYVHSKLGFLGYAKYYYTRLFEEHKDSEYRNLGLIYYGDDRVSSGKKAEGLKYYKKALYNTKDVEIATKAAYRLGNIYLKEGKADEAEYYLKKVVEGNPTYFKRNLQKNYKLAKDLAFFKKKKLAANITDIILQGIDPYDEDNYEKMLKDLAVWLDEAGEVERAYKMYSKYLDIYDYGLYDALIRENRDKLLFLRGETNTTKLFANYKKLIDTYHLDSPIGKQATFEKAKLLYKMNEFDMVLNLENDLKIAEKDFPKAKDLVINSAVNIVADKLKNYSDTQGLEVSQCESAMSMINKYTLNIPHQYDRALFYCSINSGKYKEAQKIAQYNIKTGKNTLYWVYRYSQTLLKTGKYRQFIKVSDEVIELMNIDGTDKYLDIYYDRFKAYNILRDDDNVIKTVMKLEKYFQDSYKNLQPFKSVVSIGKNRKDNLLIERFAKLIIKIQNRLKSYVESPEIEILLIQSLKHQNKYKEAIFVAQRLLKQQKLSNSVKARIFYEIGTAYQNLGNDKKSREAFEKSYDVAPENSWGKLSRGYLEI